MSRNYKNVGLYEKRISFGFNLPEHRFYQINHIKSDDEGMKRVPLPK